MTSPHVAPGPRFVPAGCRLEPSMPARPRHNNEESHARLSAAAHRRNGTLWLLPRRNILTASSQSRCAEGETQMRSLANGWLPGIALGPALCAGNGAFADAQSAPAPELRSAQP